jgi:pimeloyl-ACP methyl ester carboxylesterase
LALGALVEIECTARKPARKTAAMEIYRKTGFAESNGARIYYESIGEGEPVVLSHGYGGNHAIWFQQVPVLAQKYRVITWDQRGFGRTESPADSATPRTAALDLAALLDHLAIEKAHLVGQSMGGWAILGFAVEHPGRVLSLTFADTIGGIYTPEVAKAFGGYVQRAASAPRPDDLPVGQHPAVGAQLTASDPAKAFLYTQIGSVAAPPPPRMGQLLRDTAYDIEAIRALTVPTLFIVGQNDPITPPATIREAATQIKGSQVVEIANTGHSPYFETPDQWNAILLSFLDGH